MIKPILACKDPYLAAKEFQDAGWSIDFSQPPESGDPLVGISLFDNSFLLGITEGYVPEEREAYIGCGVVFYASIPKDQIETVYKKHSGVCTGPLKNQPWGEAAFEAEICGFRIMIAAK